MSLRVTIRVPIPCDDQNKQGHDEAEEKRSSADHYDELKGTEDHRASSQVKSGV